MDKPITKKRDILIIGGGLTFLIIVFSYSYYLQYKLNKNPVYTKGVVTEIHFRLKGPSLVNYIFTVDNNSYGGSAQFYEDFQEINIGDTCYVFYEYDNPDNSGLLKSESDSRCCKIKKPHE